MLYTYRIERANGVEFVIQEHFRKRIFTQDDVDGFQRFKEIYSNWISGLFDGDEVAKTRYSTELTCFAGETAEHGVYDLNDVSGVESLKSLYRHFAQIPVMEAFPCCVVRGAVINNKVVEIQCSYLDSVLPGEVESDIHRFYGLFDSIHWRNTIAYQRDKHYGCLFKPEDFEEAGS